MSRERNAVTPPLANPFVDFLQSLNIRALYQRVVRHTQRITRLEERMATLEQTVAVIDAETTRIGVTITDVAADLETLRGELAGRDQAAADRLAPIVTRLTAEADRLQIVASDPDQPVPPLEPTPGP